MMAAGPLYLTDRTAAVLFWGLYGAWMAFELVFDVRTLFRRNAQVRDPNSFVVAFGSLLLGWIISVSLMVAFPGAAVRDGLTAVFGAGLAIMVLGAALRTSAMLVLGRFFTVVLMVGGDQHVVEKGPYRWIRHPAYTGVSARRHQLGRAGRLASYDRRGAVPDQGRGAHYVRPLRRGVSLIRTAHEAPLVPFIY